MSFSSKVTVQTDKQTKLFCQFADSFKFPNIVKLHSGHTKSITEKVSSNSQSFPYKDFWGTRHIVTLLN